MRGIVLPDAPRLGFEVMDGGLKDRVLGAFSDDEIIMCSLADLYPLIEDRCDIYNVVDFDLAVRILKDRREYLVATDYQPEGDMEAITRVEYENAKKKAEREKQRRERENKYYVAWRKENDKRYEFRFKRVEDADVIEWLDSKPNRAEYIKHLIRADKEKSTD